MTVYAKAYRSLGGGAWAKASRRGAAAGVRVGRVGPVSFGVAEDISGVAVLVATVLIPILVALALAWGLLRLLVWLAVWGIHQLRR